MEEMIDLKRHLYFQDKDNAQDLEYRLGSSESLLLQIEHKE